MSESSPIPPEEEVLGRFNVCYGPLDLYPTTYSDLVITRKHLLLIPQAGLNVIGKAFMGVAAAGWGTAASLLEAFAEAGDRLAGTQKIPIQDIQKVEPHVPTLQNIVLTKIPVYSPILRQLVKLAGIKDVSDYSGIKITLRDGRELKLIATYGRVPLVVTRWLVLKHRAVRDEVINLLHSVMDSS